jgi:hypothetical protein
MYTYSYIGEKVLVQVFLMTVAWSFTEITTNPFLSILQDEAVQLSFKACRFLVG